MSGVYRIRVDMATHDEVMSGDVAAECSYVVVAADDDHDAVAAAVAIAHETNPRPVMPTGVAFLDFPA